MAERNIVMRILAAIWNGANAVRKVLHLVVLLFIFAVIFGALSSSAPEIPKQAALLIQPQGDLVEQIEGDPFDRAIAELMDDAPPQVLVRDIVDGLGYARDDARIKAVVLDLSGLGGGGMSKMQRVAAAVEEFRESGKPVIAHADFFSQNAYFLAAHADDVYMHTEGLMLLQGFGIYRTYYKEAIDSLKIDWNIFRAGTHKSFGEPFTRNDMSEEDRTSLSRIIDQLWAAYTSEVAAARQLQPEDVDGLVENYARYAGEADRTLSEIIMDLGFIDDLLTRPELQERIAGLAGRDEDSALGYNAAGLDDYLAQMRLLDGEPEHDSNVAVVVAAGEILPGSQPPGTIGADSAAALLARARDDDSVEAVVLRVDSPGGSAFASEVIRNEILALQDAGKTVVASMSSLAASGGYWISMAADRIVATETTITGSIGVVAMFPTFQRSLDALGVHTDGVGTSPLAGALRADRELSDDTAAIIQSLVDEDYRKFIDRVAMHRGMSIEAVDRVAQGQVWTGRDALDNGLVDQLGNLETALQVAAELAGIEDDYGVKYLEPELGPAEALILELLGGAQALGIDAALLSGRTTSVERLARRVENALQPLATFSDPRGIYSHCFCSLER